jgi:APAF-1 helical domain
VVWWCLGARDRYVWDYLIAHLIAANRLDAAEMVVTDLRWAVARFMRFGIVAPITDLAAVPTSRAQSLKVELTRITHLLIPTDPEHLILGVLLNRLHGTPGWGSQIAAMQEVVPTICWSIAGRCPIPPTRPCGACCPATPAR